MPRNGCPSALFSRTPSCPNAATVLGISPSPHALSIGGRFASKSTTEAPASRSEIAAAKPAGPPPMMQTSGSDMLRSYCAYSVRNAIVGSMRDARQAGTNAAIVAAIAMTRVATTTGNTSKPERP